MNRSKLKNLYQTLMAKWPAAALIVRRCYLGHPWNSYHRQLRGKRNVILKSNAILSGVNIDIAGDDNRIEFDAGSYLRNVRIVMRGNGHSLHIGKNVTIADGAEITFEDKCGALFIGEGSTSGKVHIAVTEPHSSIEIGRDCMLAYGIEIRTGDSHSIVSALDGTRLNHAQDVTIGDRVWIAAHALILKGSRIAPDSVIATGAIVTKKFEESGVVIAGNPAKIVKRQITWKRERLPKEDEPR